MFKIGVGPSSSHTLGPWRAAQRFVASLQNQNLLSSVTKLQVLLYGSLAKTGKGHGTDIAVLLGLSGGDPVTFAVDKIDSSIAEVNLSRQLTLGGIQTIEFNPENDLLFLYTESLPFHPNALSFLATTADGANIAETYYSIGGGFVIKEGEKVEHSSVNLPSMDRDPKHLQSMLLRAHGHKGASFLEIYQNCNIFNDGAFETFTEKGTKADNAIFVEHGKPLVFGANSDKGIKLDGFKPIVVDLNNGNSIDDLWVHDEGDLFKAQILTRMFDDPKVEGHLPRPFGVFYQVSRPTYESVMKQQIDFAKEKKPADLDKLLRGNDIWNIV